MKSLSADELIRMEVSRILRGEDKDSSGNDFNSKIKELQKKWKELPDHAHYHYKVIILGNVKSYSDEQIKKLIDFSDYEIYDFEKTYKELVLPLCSGTFYNPKEITITIRLNDREPSALKRKITTKYGDYDVRILFVPVKEIGRIMSKYRNSILKYNPRNYLSLSSNTVNKNIKETLTSSSTNEFALYNNGITLLASKFGISETTGDANFGQVIINFPQIINGGQTAYTLSKLYDDSIGNDDGALDDKEVMLKIIIVNNLETVNVKLVEELSNSTNQQSRVEEADRRSNDKMQIEIQEAIFSDFGYFYERKRGEFYFGEDSGYIDKKLVIDRYDFLRAYLAFRGQPRWARQRGSETLFRSDNFKATIVDSSDYRRMFFAYMILKKLYSLTVTSDWGNGLRYGKMAIVASIGHMLFGREITIENLFTTIDEMILKAKEEWLTFESSVLSIKENQETYSDDEGFDFDNYYKGKTVNEDVKKYFSSI